MPLSPPPHPLPRRPLNQQRCWCSRGGAGGPSRRRRTEQCQHYGGSWDSRRPGHCCYDLATSSAEPPSSARSMSSHSESRASNFSFALSNAPRAPCLLRRDGHSSGLRARVAGSGPVSCLVSMRWTTAAAVVQAAVLSRATAAVACRCCHLLLLVRSLAICAHNMQLA